MILLSAVAVSGTGETVQKDTVEEDSSTHGSWKAERRQAQVLDSRGIAPET